MPADPRRQLVGVLAALGTVGAVGSWLGGVGFVNGDAAVYAVQAAAGDLGQRQVHLGYLALASAIGRWTDDLPRALDLISVGATALALLGAAWIAREDRPAVAALGLGAALLPVAPFAEVDPLWIALVFWARAVPGPVGGLIFALAVSVSPTALLAGPWVAWGDRERWRWVAGGALLAVALLSAASLGGWWLGERGVLGAPLPRPWRAVQGWAVLLPWALVPLALVAEPGEEAEGLTWLPLLLAPPDVPVWSIPAGSLVLRAARGASHVPDGIVAVLLGVQLAVGCFTAVDRSRGVAAERVLIEEVASNLGPEDGLVAPFTLGARVAIEKRGDPYGIRWRPPEGFLRDQREAWCGAPVRRVAWLGPDGWRWVAPEEADQGCER